MNLAAYMGMSVTPLKTRTPDKNKPRAAPTHRRSENKPPPPSHPSLVAYREAAKEKLRQRLRDGTEDEFCHIDMVIDMGMSSSHALYYCKLMVKRGHAIVVDKIQLGKLKPTTIYRWI